MKSRKKGHWSLGRRMLEVLTGIPGSRVTEVLRSWSYRWFMRFHVGAENEPRSSLYEDSVLPTTDLYLSSPQACRCPESADSSCHGSCQPVVTLLRLSLMSSVLSAEQL